MTIHFPAGVPAEFFKFIPGKYVLATSPFCCIDYVDLTGRRNIIKHNFSTGDHNLVLENNIISGPITFRNYSQHNSLKILTPDGVANVHAAEVKMHFISVCPSVKLTGKSFCMTGEHAHLSRAVVEKIIVMNGGEIKSTVTKGLTYLLQGSAINKGGSKLAKAQKLGIPVIHEAEFYKLIE
jgi:NAD-dependent DNA ligase